MVANHPEWAGLVTAVLINANGAQSGLANCAAGLDVPLLQDGGSMWGTLGAASYTTQVYDQNGTLAAEIISAFYSSNPDKVAELEAAVAALL